MEEILHELVIKASWGDQAAVVFAINKLKFMSCCLICLVTAREVFLSQPDSSAITKVHKASLIFRYYFIIKLILFSRGSTNVKNGKALYAN